MTVEQRTPSGNRTRRQPGRRGPEPALTAEEVFAAALRLADAEGLERLTMRRLAEGLGTGVMSLYRYVRTKEEIVAGVAALALRGLERPPAPEVSWEARFASLMGAFRDLLRTHPSVLELMVAGMVQEPSMNHFREQALASLRAAGFSVEQAGDGVARCLSYVLGFALAERAHPPWSDEETASVRNLPSDEFPYLREAADQYRNHLSDRAFEQGVEDLVEGLRRRLG